MTRSLLAIGLCIAAMVLVGGCGYGGCCGHNSDGVGSGAGGGSDALPGRLWALAIQGRDVPFPDSGQFGAFPDAPLMDVASDGYAAFVAPVVNGDIAQSPSVLFVAQPDGTLVRVYGVGQTVDGTGAAVLGSFERVWMCPTGRVLAYVTLIGLNTFALVSAVVAGGAIADSSTILIDQEAPPGVPGGIAAIHYETLQVVTVGPDPGLCALYFLLTSIPGDTLLYTVRLDGDDPLPLLVTGDILPIDSRPILSINAFGVSETGGLLAVAVTLDGPSVDPEILIATPTLSISYVVIARPGDPLDTGTIADVHSGGPILVSPGATVVWGATGDGAFPDDVILRVSVPSLMIGGMYEQLVRSGDLAPGTVGTLATLGILNARVDVDNVAWPVFFSTITGGAGITDAIYAYAEPDFVSIVKNTDELETGVTFDAAFGLGTPVYRDATRDTSSTAFRDTLTGGTAASGQFWSWSAGDPPVAVALEGQTLRGTAETFGAFTSTSHTVAEGALLFVAKLSPSGTGILRQGP